MSGAWAREADAVWVSDSIGLPTAAFYLAEMLTLNGPGRVLLQHRHSLLKASAIIRRERKRLDPKGKVRRRSDWSASLSDESLIWRALRFVAAVDYFSLTSTKTASLREAEAILRTMHKRGRP